MSTANVAIHGIITPLVSAGLLVINITLAPSSRGRRSPSAAC